MVFLCNLSLWSHVWIKKLIGRVWEGLGADHGAAMEVSAVNESYGSGFDSESFQLQFRVPPAFFPPSQYRSGQDVQDWMSSKTKTYDEGTAAGNCRDRSQTLVWQDGQWIFNFDTNASAGRIWLISGHSSEDHTTAVADVNSFEW